MARGDYTENYAKDPRSVEVRDPSSSPEKDRTWTQIQQSLNLLEKRNPPPRPLQTTRVGGATEWEYKQVLQNVSERLYSDRLGEKGLPTKRTEDLLLILRNVVSSGKLVLDSWRKYARNTGGREGAAPDGDPSGIGSTRNFEGQLQALINAKWTMIRGFIALHRVLANLQEMPEALQLSRWVFGGLAESVSSFRGIESLSEEEALDLLSEAGYKDLWNNWGVLEALNWSSLVASDLGLILTSLYYKQSGESDVANVSAFVRTNEGITKLDEVGMEALVEHYARYPQSFLRVRNAVMGGAIEVNAYLEGESSLAPKSLDTSIPKTGESGIPEPTKSPNYAPGARDTGTALGRFLGRSVLTTLDAALFPLSFMVEGSSQIIGYITDSRVVKVAGSTASSLLGEFQKLERAQAAFAYIQKAGLSGVDAWKERTYYYALGDAGLELATKKASRESITEAIRTYEESVEASGEYPFFSLGWWTKMRKGQGADLTSYSGMRASTQSFTRFEKGSGVRYCRADEVDRGNVRMRIRDILDWSGVQEGGDREGEVLSNLSGEADQIMISIMDILQDMRNLLGTQEGELLERYYKLMTMLRLRAKSGAGVGATQEAMQGLRVMKSYLRKSRVAPDQITRVERLEIGYQRGLKHLEDSVRLSPTIGEVPTQDLPPVGRTAGNPQITYYLLSGREGVDFRVYEVEDWDARLKDSTNPGVSLLLVDKVALDMGLAPPLGVPAQELGKVGVTEDLRLSAGSGAWLLYHIARKTFFVVKSLRGEELRANKTKIAALDLPPAKGIAYEVKQAGPVYRSISMTTGDRYLPEGTLLYNIQSVNQDVFSFKEGASNVTYYGKYAELNLVRV